MLKNSGDARKGALDPLDLIAQEAEADRAERELDALAERDRLEEVPSFPDGDGKLAEVSRILAQARQAVARSLGGEGSGTVRRAAPAASYEPRGASGTAERVATLTERAAELASGLRGDATDARALTRLAAEGLADGRGEAVRDSLSRLARTLYRAEARANALRGALDELADAGRSAQ